VIDYVPAKVLLESKSLKLYLTSFRNEDAFHEDCTSASANGCSRCSSRNGCASRLLVPARRHSDRRILAGRQIAEGRVGAGPGRRTYRGALDLLRPPQIMRGDEAFRISTAPASAIAADAPIALKPRL